jgi:phage tail sheath protein FI
MNQIIGPASVYCQQRRAFLVLDAPSSWTVGGLPVATDADVNNLRALVVKDHSAVFYPRIYGPFGPGSKLTNMGASGLIAGLMARIDSTRGVWKAPAGVEADLRGILDLELSLTDLQNGVLNKLGVNCLRKFPSGIVSWGARTLDGSDDIGSEWKYISIRRTALFIEESLFRGTKWVVFENNDEPLWAKIRLNLNAFMMGLFRQGAFQGSTPDKAFFVKCDAETTTQADRNLGIVNILVGFAPLKPAEFVIIKIQQIAGEL